MDIFAQGSAVPVFHVSEVKLVRVESFFKSHVCKAVVTHDFVVGFHICLVNNRLDEAFAIKGAFIFIPAITEPLLVVWFLLENFLVVGTDVFLHVFGGGIGQLDIVPVHDLCL